MENWLDSVVRSSMTACHVVDPGSNPGLTVAKVSESGYRAGLENQCPRGMQVQILSLAFNL